MASDYIMEVMRCNSASHAIAEEVDALTGLDRNIIQSDYKHLMDSFTKLGLLLHSLDHERVS